MEADILSKEPKGYSKNAFPGSSGYCYKKVSKKNKRTGEILPLTQQEEIKKKELLHIYFSDADERTLFVADMIKNREIKKEDAWKYLNLEGYYTILQELAKFCSNGTDTYSIVMGTVLCGFPSMSNTETRSNDCGESDLNKPNEQFNINIKEGEFSF